MKVVYLTWGETPRSYGVFGSQVIGQFVNITKEIKSGSFYFISGVPIVHSGLVREKWNYKSELQKVKQKLGNIKFIWVPILSSQNLIYSKILLYKTLYFGRFFLNRQLKKINPDIVHCRSYATSLMALELKKKYNYKYKIIFDARGLFPEEYALKMKFNENNNNYLYFKKMEKILLNECDLTIAVSDTMVKMYEDIGVKYIEKIYLSTDTKCLNPVNHKGLKKDGLVYCYLGALTTETWHTLNELLGLYTELREKTPNCKLKIITTSLHEDVRSFFSQIPKNEIILTSVKTIDELNIELAEVDFGLLPYRKSSSYFEDIVGYSILGTKTVEFAAMGIPVIVNKECGGASVLIKKYNLGITYNPKTFEELTTENITKYLNDGRANERSNIAKKLFDYKQNAKKYSEIYQKLMEK